MKVVVAMDSFKGSLESLEAGKAVREGIQKACPDAEVAVKPLADGGEGTAKSLTDGLGGRCVTTEVTGPMGERVTARYGILADGSTAVMEMAEAAGITLVDREKRNPWKASTTGVGEMILDAVSRGCQTFLIGIGGSATTEGGIGMLQALGYVFFDESENRLLPEVESLGRIAAISGEDVPEALRQCRFQIACDVSNPLCGEQGAVCVYGPQKGVKEEEKAEMDEAMRRYAEQTALFTGKNCSKTPGAGAAGGLGFAFLSYFEHVELKPGISVVLDAVGLENEVKNADIVVTGEGRLDGQTAMGKAPSGVAKLAKKYGCKVLAFAGSVADDAGACNEEGIDAFFPVIRGVTTLEEAMKAENARRNIALTVEQVFRLLS